MTRNVMLILIGSRQDAAEKVQKILTGWGCFIKTRLGLHDDVLDNCSQNGLIFLELTGDIAQMQEIERKLNLVKSVDARLITLDTD
jgi:hypothetical protein